MFIVHIKFHGPTNTRGPRWSAKSGNVRAAVAQPDNATPRECASLALAALCLKRDNGDLAGAWSVADWHLSACDGGYMAVAPWSGSRVGPAPVVSRVLSYTYGQHFTRNGWTMGAVAWEVIITRADGTTIRASGHHREPFHGSAAALEYAVEGARNTPEVAPFLPSARPPYSIGRVLADAGWVVVDLGGWDVANAKSLR
jgi:hypothetical protein